MFALVLMVQSSTAACIHHYSHPYDFCGMPLAVCGLTVAAICIEQPISRLAFLRSIRLELECPVLRTHKNFLIPELDYCTLCFDYELRAKYEKD